MNVDELKGWLAAELRALIEQHKKLGDDRLITQGRYEACSIILDKLSEGEGVTQSTESAKGDADSQSSDKSS